MRLFSDAAWKSETGVLPLSLLHYSRFRWNINATNKAKVRKGRPLLWLRTREAESWFEEKASAKAALIWCEVSRRARWASQVRPVGFLIFFRCRRSQKRTLKQNKNKDFTCAMSWDASVNACLTTVTEPHARACRWVDVRWRFAAHLLRCTWIPGCCVWGRFNPPKVESTRQGDGGGVAAPSIAQHKLQTFDRRWLECWRCSIPPSWTGFERGPPSIGASTRRGSLWSPCETCLGSHSPRLYNGRMPDVTVGVSWWM